MKLVGRHDELKRIQRLINSDNSELLAVTGRRRVGKTFLIREAFEGRMFFQFTGLYQSTLDVQLERFGVELQRQFNTLRKIQIRNWFEAFDVLRQYITQSRLRRKKVIFIDEFPWVSTHKSGFLAAFTDFWNTCASARKDILVIISGSATSWMIQHIFRNKGGLYNRVTERIELQPFTLRETQLFLKEKKINLHTNDIIKIYMVLGGIPYYLDHIHNNESTDQAIQRLFYGKNAPFGQEYKELFASLFNNSDAHEEVLDLLAQHTMGLTRQQIIAKTKMTTGGGLSKVLEELSSSGFISAYIPLKKKLRDAIYILTDPFTLYYKKYVAQHPIKAKNIWNHLSTTPSWLSWSGLAFENICWLHTDDIKRALKIEGVYTEISKWHHKGTDEMQGAQIDLVIDRADNVIHLCEINYSLAPYTIDAGYYNILKEKIASFSFFTKTKKNLFVTFITVNGMTNNMYYSELVKHDILAAELF